MAAVKALQQWCRIQCEGYRDVSITNMTTSFRDGLAFCALIHKHRPDLIKFDSLKKEDVYDNNKLAFRIAEEELGIPALLDAEDMVALKVPDRLSILTYVSQYYNYFHGRSPIGGMAGIKRPAEGTTNEPCGKKNQMVTAKVFPSSRPARENSPPPSANITRPSPSPKQTRNATQHVLVEKPQSTGTLSNKCVSCNNHVHLVQRHLVDGKLYHRSCAKSTSHTTSLLRDLPTNTPVSKFTPLPDSTKNTVPPNQTSSRLGPTWLKEKPSSSSFATTFSSSTTCRPASGVSSAAIRSQTPSNSTSMASQTSSERTFTTSTTTNTSAPSTSNTAASILESRRKFFQSDCNANSKGKKTTAVIVDVNKGSTLSGGVQEPTVGQTVTVAVNVAGAGRKETNLDKGGDKAACVGGKASLKQEASEGKTSKASAAAFISKKLTEENNNNNKLSWVKNTDKLPEIETPKREMENNRARIRLRVDPSLLGDLNSPDATSSASSSANRSALSTSTSDRKPGSASPNNSASENESPADWRSRLKPVAKSGGSTQLTKPWTNGAGKSQTSELSVGPSSSSSSIPSLSVSGSPSASKEIQTGQREQTAYGSKSESKMSKTKPGYIPKEDILKELQEIEDNLNELEKQGVEMEMRLRSSEEEGKDDSLMDELMVEWFNLIRNKQVAMRRESELVYIGRTQDLEEQQPSVEEELRRLIDKPEHIKTEWDKKREQQLMEKLLEIVNDRNSIVEGLDEDRLREEEEDEQLNKMLKNFNIKKDKPKKESPVTKLFRWGSKKEK